MWITHSVECSLLCRKSFKGLQFRNDKLSVKSVNHVNSLSRERLKTGTVILDQLFTFLVLSEIVGIGLPRASAKPFFIWSQHDSRTWRKFRKQLYTRQSESHYQFPSFQIIVFSMKQAQHNCKDTYPFQEEKNEKIRFWLDVISSHRFLQNQTNGDAGKSNAVANVFCMRMETEISIRFTEIHPLYRPQ